MSELVSLKDPPTDGITNVEYHPSKNNLLLSSSWDKTIRLYDTNTREMKCKTEHDTPLLDTCFGSDSQAFSAGLSGAVYSIDLVTGRLESIGKHEAGTRSVCWSPDLHTLYSGSWDKSVRLWDMRAKGHLAGKHMLPHKVYSMDLRDNTLAVALSHDQIYVYDIRRMDTLWKKRETTLRYMLKCVRVNPGGKALACSSVEGRVSIDYFGDDKDETRAFKIHRQTLGNAEVVYPVNSLSFHPSNGTFASGGSDGMVGIWNPVSRQRFATWKFPEEVSNVAFNSDGSQLAIARSYTYDEGSRPHEPDAIYIRHLDENDFKPKRKSRSSRPAATPAAPRADTL